MISIFNITKVVSAVVILVVIYATLQEWHYIPIKDRDKIIERLSSDIKSMKETHKIEVNNLEITLKDERKRALNRLKECNNDKIQRTLTSTLERINNEEITISNIPGVNSITIK